MVAALLHQAQVPSLLWLGASSSPLLSPLTHHSFYTAVVG